MLLAREPACAACLLRWIACSNLLLRDFPRTGSSMFRSSVLFSIYASYSSRVLGGLGLTLGGFPHSCSCSRESSSAVANVAVEVGTIISASCYCVVQLNWSDVPIRVVREFILFPGIEHKLHASIPLFYYDGSTVTTFKQQFLKDLAYIKFALKMD